MKYIFILGLLSSAAFGGECALTGKLSSGIDLETSFRAQSAEACAELAERATTNRFYGLVEEKETLLETTSRFIIGDAETRDDSL